MSFYKHDTNRDMTEYARLDMPREEDIENFLHKHPEMVEKDIMIVGRQVYAGGIGIIDLLGMDRDGNVVVIEVKKGAASRDVVSQILHYAVWARNIDYNDLNKAYDNLIKKYGNLDKKCGNLDKTEGGSGGHPDLHAAMECRFGVAPQSFNSSQSLYIVGEGIEQKTDDICTYLSQNRIKIRCISVEFFSDGKGGDGIEDRIRAVHTEAVTEKQDDSVPFDKWNYNMRHCDAEIRNAINNVISYVENELGCPRVISEKAATCTFYAGGDSEHGTRFAVIYAYKTKDYGNFEFLADPGRDFDDRVSKSTFAFGNVGREIKIVPDNFDLITECARHALDAARKAGTGNAVP